VLLRFTDNAWQELATSVVSSDAESVLFSGSTPGFSVFAITAKAAATPADGSDADAGDGDTGPAESLCIADQQRCSGNELQQCASDLLSWEHVDTCVHGCDASTYACKPSSDAGATDTEGGIDSTMIIILILLVIIIIVAVVLFMRMKS